jgi:hypothetical protein
MTITWKRYWVGNRPTRPEPPEASQPTQKSSAIRAWTPILTMLALCVYLVVEAIVMYGILVGAGFFAVTTGVSALGMWLGRPKHN